jgi:hypothetical protein
VGLLLAAVVDVGDLVQVIWTSAATGLGVTCAFALAILGMTRALDLQRDGRAAGAALFGALGVAALAVVAVALVLAVVVMTAK